MEAHYLIFHPNSQRVSVSVSGKAILNEGILSDWQGDIWVDKMEYNEDPFVFNEQWVYSYCHATQLRRARRIDQSYVKKGSVLFFCSGNSIDQNQVTIDTVIFVEFDLKWTYDSSTGKIQLPDILRNHKSARTPLWNRHLKYPYLGQHRTPKLGNYTYLARMYKMGEEDHSFLPLDKHGQRTTFSIDLLSNDLQLIIKKKRVGKWPVLMDENQKDEILQALLKNTVTRVVGLELTT